MAEESQTQKKAQAAEMVVPPNKLKEKVGSGGFDEKAITKAQDQIKNNTVDFQPIAATLMTQMEKAIADARSGAAKGTAAMREILAPAMQLKAQGTMFHYPLVTEISNILVNFLETVTDIDADVLEIITAHKTSLTAVLSGKIKEADKGKVGKELCFALLNTCERYAKTRKNP
jgi:hypothetical protein